MCHANSTNAVEGSAAVTTTDPGMLTATAIAVTAFVYKFHQHIS